MFNFEKVGYNKTYTNDYNIIVGVHYGSNGITPCMVNCEGGCVSSSGDSLCGSYWGHKEIEVDGKKVYLVKCMYRDCI